MSVPNFGTGSCHQRLWHRRMPIHKSGYQQLLIFLRGRNGVLQFLGRNLLDNKGLKLHYVLITGHTLGI